MGQLVSYTRPKRYFYAINVHMSASFEKLNEIATKQLGAEIEVGDILICDNVNHTRRKVLQKTATGFMIYYGLATGKDNEFTPLAETNGILKSPRKEIL